jgi:hypothetical protein
MNLIQHHLVMSVCKMRCACGSADATLMVLAGGFRVATLPTFTVNPFAVGGANRTTDANGGRWSF